MKRATPLVSPNSRDKRVCFDKDNGKVSSFKPDAVPENHFHLGASDVFAVVSGGPTPFDPRTGGCGSRLYNYGYFELEESEPNNFILQQEDAPPHWHLSVRDWSNITVPNQWIDSKEPPAKACIAWPPRSPHLTPCDFYLRGFIKDYVYTPPLSADLSD
ncbi:uncharacterized protein TNCV_858491 [Trichonephila clavipes]|nr:uncharacterized protein TNCV_858491 [Trichonephila clavipes]